MSKTLYYNCPRCLASWLDEYQDEYGECSDDCPTCGLRHINPVTKYKKSKAIKEKNTERVRKFVNKKVREATLAHFKEEFSPPEKDQLTRYLGNKANLSEKEKEFMMGSMSDEIYLVMEAEQDKLNKNLIQAMKDFLKKPAK